MGHKTLKVDPEHLKKAGDTLMSHCGDLHRTAKGLGQAPVVDDSSGTPAGNPAGPSSGASALAGAITAFNRGMKYELCAGGWLLEQNGAGLSASGHQYSSAEDANSRAASVANYNDPNGQ